MERETAKEVRTLLRKIETVEEKIKRLHSMHGWDLRIGTESSGVTLVIPKELQETVYMLVETAYNNELNKLEIQLKDM